MVDACAWKSETRLVPPDQIEWLFSLLLKAEERRWLASISPVNSCEHDDLGPEHENENLDSSFVDAGSLLLRHGKCIKRIHSKFHHLEPSHYCVNVTANSTNPDRPSSQMKVVSSSSNSSTQEKSPISRTSTESSQDAGGDITSRHPLFELYKNAVLCAQYPVLSVSQVASPNTPYLPVSPSPSSLPMQRKFSFSKIPSSSSAAGGAKSNKSYKRRTSTSSDAGCVSPEVSLPTSKDALQELVMNVFELGKRQHQFLCETEIPKKVPRAKEPQRFLVEELLSQLVVLERNHHPFYSVQAFMDKNAYSEWVIVEKEKIEGLIRSFWHYAHPPVRELPLESPEFHKQYVELMKRLVRYESKRKEPHPVYGGAIPTAPLSSKACQLLKEFELRYGVGMLFCKISYLEYLVKYFENELWYIEHTIISLQDVMEHVFICREIFVEDEFKMLLSILSNLLAKTKYSLTRIRRIFPAENSPKDGVPALVSLFELTLDSARLLQSEFPSVFSALLEARQFSNNLTTEPTCDLLASYVRKEMESRYERVKVIATDELRQNFSPPELLLKLILEIHLEVNYYNTSYKHAFSRYFDMMELAAVKFYSLLMLDVEQLCQNPPRTQCRDSMETSMLCLAFRLSKLDKEWAKYIPYSHQSWRQPFQGFALQWLDAVGHYFQRLVPQLTSIDVWEAVEVHIRGSQERSNNMKPGRPIPPGPLGGKSASLLSLTPSQHSAFNTVGPSNRTPAKSRGKEPLQSRKDHLGSSPPARVKSPRWRRPGVLYDSSSEEETPSVLNVANGRSGPKSDRKQQVNVVAQIHVPRAKGDSNNKLKIVQHQSSSRGEPSEKEFPTSVKVDQEEYHEQGSSGLAKARSLGESISSSATAVAQGSDATMEESIQSGKNAQFDQPDENEGITLDQTGDEDVTSLKTSDNHENTKRGLSGHGNGNDNETSSGKLENGDKLSREVSGEHADDLDQSQCASKVDDSEENKPKKPTVPEHSTNGGTLLKESCAGKPLENGANTKDGQKHSEGAENGNTPEMNLLEGSAEKNEVEISGFSMKKESCVVKSLENGKHPSGAHLSESQHDVVETQNDTRCKLDPLESGTEKNEVEHLASTMTEECCMVQPLENGEASLSASTQEPPEEAVEVHLPENEINPEDAQMRGSESHMTQEDAEVFPEGDSISEYSWHSKASESRNQSTPFENDTTDESDSDGSIHTSDSFNFIEDEGKTRIPRGKAISGDGAFADPNSVSSGDQRQLREGAKKEASKISPAPEVGLRSTRPTVQPIEDGGISGKERKDSNQRNSCQTCPGRQRCLGTEEDKGRQDVCKPEVDDSKQSSVIAGGKVAQKRPSAPVTIPAPRNKLLAKLRDSPGGSGGSKLSECESFFTAVGSIRSGNSVESFHSTRSGSSSSQSRQAGSNCDNDRHSDVSHSSDDMPHVLPISSSFVDVICAVNRVAAFACHLCKILCPDESLQRAEHTAAACPTSGGDDDLRNESLGIKGRLHHKLIQVMFSFVRLYSDNVLGMETCGLPDKLLTDILGDRVQRHLRTQRDARHLQGCRYNPSARQCCNTRDSSGTFIPPCEGISRTAMNPGEFEPLTQQMGVRMSNVAILRNILAWLLDHVTSAISNHDSVVSDHHLTLSLSYCENGPSLDGISVSSAAEGRSDVPQPRTEVLHDTAVLTMLNDRTEHFCRLEISQVKLVTYRINKLFKEVLRSLLDLDLPGFTIRKRLTPAMELLSRELQRFHGVLYPDNFSKFLTDLWTAVARNFEEESDRLVRRKSLASQQSKLLLQAIAYLMQFFHGGGDGLAYDTLASAMDPTVQNLQLYTSPTDRLISMYHSLYKQVLIMQQQYRSDEFTSSVSVSSHQASANAPADFVIQAMLKDLHTTRKCFSGAALVEWMENYVRDNGYDNLGVCIGSTETETGLDFGQYLLERGMLICVSSPPRFDRRPSTERSGQDQYHETAPKERGSVIVSEDVQPEIRINDLDFTTRSSRSSLSSSSSPTSRSTGAGSTGSEEEADDEGDDDDDKDFLGSASDIWRRADSRLSERCATFYNHPKAFYKFICEEDSSRTEVKISLGITDRLNLPIKLKHILCVLYARRDSDKAARTFLRRLPRRLLDDAVGRRGVQCFPLDGVCQTL